MTAVFNSTETLLVFSSVTARSGRASLLNSPTATEVGPPPVRKSVGAEKLPVPSPSSTDTPKELPLVTAKSAWLSPLKSPTATDEGELLAKKLVGAEKLPVPSP